MKNKLVKRMFAAGLAAVMCVGLLAGCGGKGGSGEGGSAKGGAKDANFTWWIYQTDGQGTYYDKYEDSPSVQYINAQYWNTAEGGIGTEENGTKLDLSFLVPISGSETDNFNTMIGTGEYPEILDLSVSSESPQAMHENGVLMDITEYVEEYMPNYLACLEANPELKPLVQVQEDDGSVHYYAIYAIGDGVKKPWEGTCYRRDWVVKYAKPTEYVWDWESDYVKENGHPAVTPLDKAVGEDNLEGWKKNDVTSFEADYGEDPDEDYEDNVIFPSGTSDPLTISDWEWMFEAFDKAIDERGWADNSNAYCTSVAYGGYFAQGDLVSSFGGGTGYYYVKDGEVSFDGDSDTFKTYLECLNNWYEKGWLDSQFSTRSGDIFFMINSVGVNQGMVGMWCGLSSTLGDSLRVTCQNEEDQQDAFAMGCALPINDVYGSEEQMYQEPDALYQDSRKGTGIGITNKAEEKDLAALFTFLDWTYTTEGASVLYMGLNEEQVASVDLNPDIFADNGLKAAYVEKTDDEGKIVYEKTVDQSNEMVSALTGIRMTVGTSMSGTNGEYTIDNGNPRINEEAFSQWSKYINTGNIMEYSALLNVEESEVFSKMQTAVIEYQNINVPGVIAGTMSWDEYVKGFESIDPDSVVPSLQKYMDLAKTDK
ncbi:MAG: hypothetical protein HFH23_06375 [Ruminococcus sp.]|nr:hypothetical protein [Ruminococcus sp.]